MEIFAFKNRARKGELFSKENFVSKGHRAAVIFLCLFFPMALCALMTGNPSAPSILEEGIWSQDVPVNLRMGYHAMWIGDQKLRVFKSDEEKFTSLRIPTRMQIFSLTLNVKERFDFSLFSGSERMFLRLQMQNALYELKSRQSFFVAGGAKFLIIENKEFSFGIDGKYLFFRAHPSSFLKNATPFSFKGGEIQQKEWQVTPAISYKTGILIPYFGIPCRFAKVKLKYLPFIDHPLLELKSLHKAGICLGVTISSGREVFLNLEGEWLSENGSILSSELRF